MFISTLIHFVNITHTCTTASIQFNTGNKYIASRLSPGRFTSHAKHNIPTSHSKDLKGHRVTEVRNVEEDACMYSGNVCTLTRYQLTVNICCEPAWEICLRQWPLSGVHSIMMVKSAQPGKGGRCTLQLRQIRSPHFSSTPICTLWS